jgi:hypothetical protein
MNFLINIQYLVGTLFGGVCQGAQTLVHMLKVYSKPEWGYVLETCSLQYNFRTISRTTYYPGSFLVAYIFISTRDFGLEKVCEETCKYFSLCGYNILTTTIHVCTTMVAPDAPQTLGWF